MSKSVLARLLVLHVAALVAAACLWLAGCCHFGAYPRQVCHPCREGEPGCNQVPNCHDDGCCPPAECAADGLCRLPPDGWLALDAGEEIAQGERAGVPPC